MPQRLEEEWLPSSFLGVAGTEESCAIEGENGCKDGGDKELEDPLIDVVGEERCSVLSLTAFCFD
eukprot:CAMPEP_0184534062 /NCGR_PEP_ID=MMETSP0198_2-20121128/15120_1 /TAXON_ID=1112570 /ORGANISM="Thraustochytrium sp., Strain LLF1b" /LENGTH=64 /DNA_ID=CAMNT_0026926941 /DNA_START=759 /DNA_END=950 /DNA_ORIENTATION=+